MGTIIPSANELCPWHSTQPLASWNWLGVPGMVAHSLVLNRFSSTQSLRVSSTVSMGTESHLPVASRYSGVLDEPIPPDLLTLSWVTNVGFP